MSIEDFRWLSDSLRDLLQQDPLRRGDPLSVEAQVAVGLYRLGHGSSYVTIGHVFSIGKETADKATGRFVNAVLARFRRVAICYPPLARGDQWDKISASFEAKHGIPNIVGAIDGTHIPLATPADDRWKGYINRKSWASIVFQCVVDGDGEWGSRSELGHSITNGTAAEPMIPHGTYLIGDAGYPSNVRVLLPYLSTATAENEEFNFIQSSTRIIVEQSFGSLKNRFRILLHAQMARPLRARNNAFACMILHNLLNKRGSLYLQAWDARNPAEQVFNELPDERGEGGRRRVADEGQVSMSAIRDMLRDQLC
ncbi:uncharacterized protein PGTG_20678 [Puccinia graminis f. sp. tritici CRL 75-36-700-3]|uniref:DDE Tnp4 domain-containing protein n=1 Tax=Puccinia graminis f. sp. tritici (strain CRL 75-36-700-3 / race SCCL) TaxID=418459 RepID=H6QPC8_PUCGT|nr:uncharacterized protein PGTG_20678 [Puccinia graminis f. sp. tritici CRL 75-36-700-3]EHS63584.1 hypothetical protein PGTG_20678 [Puccinia graminis f. sp. tritici CRL 75-36-700-3]